MKTGLALMMFMALTGPSDGPPAKALDDDNYTAVRKDVLERLNLSDRNLPKCESSLNEAQDDSRLAQTNIGELKAAADLLQQQKRALEDHVTHLETVIARYETYTGGLEKAVDDDNAFLAGWEAVDGAVGLFAGYALGTGTCVGMAYVFNQPAFGGSAP